MKLVRDLVPCAVVCDDFQRWLDEGNGLLTVRNGEENVSMLLKLEKNPAVEYVYRLALNRDGSITWDPLMKFCGVYDMERQALYMMGDSLCCFAHGPSPLVAKTGRSMIEELCGKINRRVEEIIDNDRNNLTVQEIADPWEMRDLQCCQEHRAREEAIQMIFKGETPDGRFHSDYAMEELPEDVFMSWLQDPEGFVQSKAEQYIEINQKRFFLQFLRNDALLAEYQTLVNNTGSPIHQMKAIADALSGSNAKRVSVTVQKGGEELTFKMKASQMKGHHTYYSTHDILAADRCRFQQVFGRNADFRAEDVVRITYGKKTLYEAEPVQAETLTADMEMGGM